MDFGSHLKENWRILLRKKLDKGFPRIRLKIAIN